MVLSRAQFMFDAYESQTAFHEFWFCAYRLMLEFSHTVPQKSPTQIFGVFWLGTTHVLPPDSKHARRIPSVASRTRFWGYPLPSYMGTPKIDCRAF